MRILRLALPLVGLWSQVSAEASQGLMTIRYFPSKRFLVVEMRDNGTGPKDRAASDIYDYVVQGAFNGQAPREENSRWED